MSSFTTLRRLFGAALIACCTAACSGVSSSSLPPAGLSVSDDQHAPLRGGSFSGAYAGRFRHLGNEFSLQGSGKASFLGAGTEGGSIAVDCGPNCYMSGSFTFTSTRHSANGVTVDFTEEYGQSFCGRTFDWRVKTGTGKFAKAFGSGSVTFNCSGDSYNDNWSGDLYF
jgi:hypothetical protein